MNFYLTKEVAKKIKYLKKNNRSLFIKIRQTLIIFQSNERNLMLRNHKLTGKLKNSWSISVKNNYRIVYYITENYEAVIYKIGTHDEVYQMQ